MRAAISALKGPSSCGGRRERWGAGGPLVGVARALLLLLCGLGEGRCLGLVVVVEARRRGWCGGAVLVVAAAVGGVCVEVWRWDVKRRRRSARVVGLLWGKQPLGGWFWVSCGRGWEVEVVVVIWLMR